MNTKPDGGPAFPHVATGDGGNYTEGYVYTRFPGISQRDYFAAQALAGVVDKDLFLDSMTVQECDLQIRNAAALAYRLADAILAERAK